MPHEHDIIINDYQGWGQVLQVPVHQVLVQCRIVHQVDQVLTHKVQVQYTVHHIKGYFI